MNIVDLHCDALLKLHMDPGKSFTNDSDLEVNAERLVKGNVKLQLFAIFIEPEVTSHKQFQVALEQIDLFHREVVGKHPNIKKIVHWSDVAKLKDGEIGAILTLEGAEAFGNDLVKLRTLYQLGVKSIGLTWNNANLCADGVGERRGAGLTKLGFEVVTMNNQEKVWTDMSHLSINSFWDAVEVAEFPVATHSNSKVICGDRRNLLDDQAKAIIDKKGFIGMVFNPPFLNGKETATMDDVLRHIDHFCGLGGSKHVALGSDFDGITMHVKDLEHAGKYQNLVNELLKRFTEEEVRGFAYQNVIDRLPV
ncbi:dipeptidase [Salipaludibacillus sp. CF4.18]|uniref:dipeptidase n=1 Tax=Salipaludibacillus sp. CF4.18 TaxID=3373081 RepID=UPI003EE6402D